MVLTHIIRKILGDPNEKELKRIQPIVSQINTIEERYQKELTKADIPKKTEEFKKRIQENGESLDDILPEAFALVKYCCRMIKGDTWDIRGKEYSWENIVHYDVQLIGGIILHSGKIAEMKTGEGKTLVSTLPIYLNALTGKGVHVVTVNDYLAKRDAEWMGGVFRALGLTVGSIYPQQPFTEKKAAYACDITYGTNNEFGFDYLRDNMATHPENLVQRGLYYAIVDEVDSILVDEARTPLIISAPAAESTSKYQKYSQLIRNLKENKHYNLDEKTKSAVLTEEGIGKMEQLLNVDNIYTDAGFTEVHHIEQALKAHAAFRRDIDYVVNNGEVIIVDEFTGRLMPGRRYSDGLHQAIEAKENVEIKRESRTLATITFQNYFRLYDKLSGMTGTAITEAEEFYKIYGLDTIVIPTNLPIARKDLNDQIYKNEAGKFKGVALTVKELHKKGQPVLIGTISIERSELLSKLLTAHGIQHNVLNAKQHEREAEIVSKAGQKGAVTIATNMAGRGTDIKLGEGVQELGGLYVIGTERHESRRIDNQLRGRSGRQGDAGTSQFYVSMEDSLMRLFGSDRVRNMMNVLNFPEDTPIENSLISKSIESAQKRVEGHNFDIRKHVLEYDDVMNRQREVIYSLRNKMLSSENIKNEIIVLIEKQMEGLVSMHTVEKDPEDWNYQEISETINAIHRDAAEPLALETLEKIGTREELIEVLKKHLFEAYQEKEARLPDPQIFRSVERNVYLRAIDALWMEHIDEMSRLRDAVALQGYAQKNPLIEYQQEGYEKFRTLLANIQTNVMYTLFHLHIQEQPDVSAGPTENEAMVSETNEDDIEDNLRDTPEDIAETPPMPPENTDGKVGRNDPCPCGSGKKYKKCCGQ